MPISLKEILKQGVDLLQSNKSINTASLDSRILLQFALDITHEELLLNKNRVIDDNSCKLYLSFIKRRKNNEPISYITGEKEFFGYQFQVNKDTLIPRPDTEILVEEACKLFPQHLKIEIIDIGTGSGCIAISLAKYYKNAIVTATDINKNALKIADINADNLNATIDFQHNSNFASNINNTFDLIISNPPYIGTKEINILQKDVKDFEPILALDGGEDGLDPYRIIAKQSRFILKKSGYILVEFGINQQEEIIQIFTKQGFKKRKEYKDLSGIIRCLLFSYP